MQFITVQMNDAIRHLSTVAKVTTWASSIDVEFTHERGTKVCFNKDMFTKAISLRMVQVDYRRTEVQYASELKLTEEEVLLVAAAMYAIKADTISACKAFIKLEAPQPVQTTVVVERQVIIERQVVVERPVVVRRTERTITTRDHNTASGAALVGLGLAILMGGR